MNAQIDNAIDLANKGWHVFPIRPDKTPYISQWQNVATTDTTTIEKWWGDFTDALVGVVPGKSGKTVIDLDRHAGKASGFDTTEALDLPHSAQIERTSLSGNGTHLWYDGEAQSSNGIYPGIDRKSVGGYVAVAYDLPAPENVTEPLPGLYKQRSGAGTVRPYTASVAQWTAMHSDQAITGKVQRKFDYLAQGEPLTGHEDMLKLQKTIVMWAAEGEGGVPELLDAMRTRWIESPHGDDDEPVLEWDRALATAIAQFGGDIADEVEEPADIAKNPIKLVSLSELRNRPAPEWWVENMWQQNTIGLLAGPGGVGKSFMMLDWTACIGLGQPWQGHKVKKGRVLYVAAEGVSMFPKRIDAWEQHNDTLFPESEVRFIEAGFNLGDGESVEFLKQHVADFEADVIIIDTFSQLASVESENDAAQIASALRAARSIREARPGSTVLIVHHATKDGKGYRGSSALRDNVDTLVAVHTAGQGKFKMSTEAEHGGKQKDGEPVQLGPFALEGVGGSAVVVSAKEGTTAGYNEALTLVMGDYEPHGMSDLVEGYRESSEDDDTDDQTIRKAYQRIINDIVKTGGMQKIGSGRYMKYQLVHIPVAD